MALKSLLPFRIAQAVLAIVILGLTAWGTYLIKVSLRSRA